MMVRGALGATPFIRVGRPPRRTLFYRLLWPIASIRCGEVDILSANKVCVVAGIHPSTGKPYHWPEECLLDYEFRDVPLVDERNVDYLINWLTEEEQTRKTLVATAATNIAIQAAKASGRKIIPAKVSRNVPARIAEAREGERNYVLFHELLHCAHRLSVENIRAHAHVLNNMFAKPLPAYEVRSIADSVCRYKIEDRLFRPGEQKILLPFGKDMIAAFAAIPEALFLYVHLRANVSHKGVFTIPQKATAKVLGWGSNRVAKAVNVLVEQRLISLDRAGGTTRTRCMPSQYRWGA